MRRPEQSIITIPLPIVRLRHLPLNDADQGGRQTTPLAKVIPCDLAILMCDPEWQVKLGSEILVFIHRPEENFSDLLSRWRRSQIYLDQDYEWLMPPRKNICLVKRRRKSVPYSLFLSKLPTISKRVWPEPGCPLCSTVKAI
ncbi:hypothetical protein NON20_04765 [Synechocystis sp. B12]|nr:hypothetical protein NON20_04765 [Synechocystis sp. B12]